VGTKRDLADEVDWVGVDHSGEHVLVGYERLPSMEVFSRDLAESRRLPEGSNAHGDAAQTADGRNVWVFQNTATDMIEMADLGTGEVTPLLPIPFETNPDIGLHVSGNCAETPGWVLVSTYGARTPPEGAEHSWMDTQLFMLELARDPVVWRLCHTRCYTAETAEEDPMYFAEAFAAVNTSGTRVYYGSNWGDIEPDYTDAYMLALPDEWSRVIAE
jgi:hypothetical protein